jgi:hypothetical protein
MSRLLILLFSFITITRVQAVEQTVGIGGKVIKILPPPGLVRCDGHWPKVDHEIAASLPPGNRMLAFFAEPEDLEKIKIREQPDMNRFATFQFIKSLEFSEVGSKEFKKEREQFREHIGANSLDTSNGNLVIKFLGEFGNSDSMVGFNMQTMARVQRVHEKELNTHVSVVASPVNERLVLFYVGSKSADPASRAWTEKTVLDWTTIVAKANPEGFHWGSRSQISILSSIVSGIVAYLVIYSKRGKN